MNSVVVLKVGGSLGTKALGSLIAAIEAVRSSGRVPVVVHGGGPRISEALRDVGLELPFVEGQRVTPPEAMPIVERVLCDEVNMELTEAIDAAGIPARSFIRSDQVLFASPLPGMGRTATMSHVNSEPLRQVLAAGQVPVIAPVATEHVGDTHVATEHVSTEHVGDTNVATEHVSREHVGDTHVATEHVSTEHVGDTHVTPDEKGTAACNVNADLAASAIARALSAERVVFFTDVDGIYSNYKAGERIFYTTSSELSSKLKEGKFEGGMRPKVYAVLEALSSGALGAFVIHGANADAAVWAVTHSLEAGVLEQMSGVRQGTALGTCVVGTRSNQNQQQSLENRGHLDGSHRDRNQEESQVGDGAQVASLNIGGDVS